MSKTPEPLVPEAYRGREQTLVKHLVLEKYIERVAFNILSFSNEFVFVDGPTESSPVTGEELFDMDLIHIAQKNPSVQAFIDHRLNTIRCLKKALQQTHHVTYNPITKLGHVYPKARYKRARILVADK